MKNSGKIFAAAILLVFALFLLPGCSGGSGSSGNVDSEGSGTFLMSVSWPDSGDKSAGNAKMIPESSSIISVSVTGPFLEAPITASISSGETTLTISNIPSGNNVATIKALNASGAVTAQRKESFIVNAGETTTSSSIPLGIAINESGMFEPSSLELWGGQSVYIQNWSSSQYTVNGLGSATTLAPPSTDSSSKIIFSEMLYTASKSATATGAGNSANITTTGGFSDEFTNSAIDSGWTQLIQDASTISQDGLGVLNISSVSGSDMWESGNYKAPRIYQRCRGDWTVETKLTGVFDTTFEASGLFLQFDKNDTTDSVRILERNFSDANDQGVMGSDNRAMQRIGSPVTNFSASTTYLRVQKIGTTYYLTYSEDGSNWNSAGNWTTSETPYYVGLFCISSVSATSNSTNFDYFHYTQQ